MLENIDSSLIDWSRAQFALTAIYHWIFVPLTLGLAVIMGIMETVYYRTGDKFWKHTAKFWMKLFGINFAIGVATGLDLEFEFGTNWSNYSWFVGDIFGAPLAIEGILAFFMEATFIAVMFFGWDKVSKRFHLASTWLTGLGATYGELKANRNSIIIEPNKPVISGKCKDPKHGKDNLFGVFDGVYADDVVAYMERSIKQSKHFKILTTPESFHKVQEAFEEMDMDIRYNSFLLFDECHKIVKDSGFRPDITLPMDLFFECEQKALVSATPIEFTDPRFEERFYILFSLLTLQRYEMFLNYML